MTPLFQKIFMGSLSLMLITSLHAGASVHEPAPVATLDAGIEAGSNTPVLEETPNTDTQEKPGIPLPSSTTTAGLAAVGGVAGATAIGVGVTSLVGIGALIGNDIRNDRHNRKTTANQVANKREEGLKKAAKELVKSQKKLLKHSEIFGDSELQEITLEKRQRLIDRVARSKIALEEAEKFGVEGKIPAKEIIKETKKAYWKEISPESLTPAPHLNKNIKDRVKDAKTKILEERGKNEERAKNQERSPEKKPNSKPYLTKLKDLFITDVKNHITGKILTSANIERHKRKEDSNKENSSKRNSSKRNSSKRNSIKTIKGI
jgi:hypothetical protein